MASEDRKTKIIIVLIILIFLTLFLIVNFKSTKFEQEITIKNKTNPMNFEEKVIIKNQTNINVSYFLNNNANLIELTKSNNYSYTLNNGNLKRSGRSGPGTGTLEFINYTLKKGYCNNTKGITTGCQAKSFGEVFCLINELNQDIKFELTFITWLQANKNCYGDCNKTLNTAFYILER